MTTLYLHDTDEALRPEPGREPSYAGTIKTANPLHLATVLDRLGKKQPDIVRIVGSNGREWVRRGRAFVEAREPKS